MGNKGFLRMMFIAVFSGRFFPTFSMRFIDYLSFKYCFLKMMRETIHTKNKQIDNNQNTKLLNVCSGNIVEVAHENREKTIIIHYYYFYCVRSHQGFARKNDGGKIGWP